jgi:hypothetical protein
VASLPKVVDVLSCGFLLLLGLSNAAQAGNAASAKEEIKGEQSGSDQSDRRQGGQTGEKQMNDEMVGSQSKEGKTVKGEVLRVEGENYFVKDQDGKEVRLHTDKTTQKTGSINQGDRIEAKVNEQNHALSIRSAQGTDAAHGNEGGRDSLHETDAAHGNDAGRTTDSTLEPGKTGSMGR